VGEPSNILFLIGGNAGHGKDTLAEFLQHYATLWCETYSTAYAYGIKKILHDTYSVPWEILNANKDVKESTYIYVGRQQTKVTIRRALQSIGQFHRETFGPTCWASATLNRVKKNGARISIVTDARHPAEEIHWIGEEASDAGYVVVPVRIRRPDVPVNPDHPSESLILSEPDSSFSFLIENTGSLEELKRAAEQLLCAAVILQKTGNRKLKKRGNGFVVRADQGFLPYEPVISPDDAEILAKSCIDREGFYHGVEELSFDLLKGSAC